MLTVSHAVRESRDTLELFGSEGSVHIAVLNQGRIRTVTGTASREEEHPPAANLHQPIVEDFVTAVRENRAPAVTGETGLGVNRVLQAIYGG